MLKKITSYLLNAPSFSALKCRNYLKSSHSFFSTGSLKNNNKNDSSNFHNFLNSCNNINLKKKLIKYQNNQIQSSKLKNEFGLYTKNEFFYEVDPSDLSLNPLQRDCFEKSKEGNILLFENAKRLEIIKELISKISKRLKVQLCLTGPRGVGKSHTLALLSLYLRNKIDDTAIFESNEGAAKPKFRVLYFNNPSYYFTTSFRELIPLDLISFFGEDLGKNYFKEITEEFLKIHDLERSEIIGLIRKVVNLYEENGYIPLLVIDQINLLERNKLLDLEIFLFFNQLQELFSQRILSASLTDEKLNKLLASSQVIEFYSKNFFEHDKEFENYLQKLGYFKNHVNDATFLEKVIEITGKHPYEVMKLNKHYITINWSSNNQEESLELLNIRYMEDRKMEFFNSHSNFITEKIKNNDIMNIYLEIIAYMDSNALPKKFIKSDYQFVNKNFMEIDKDMKITSLCPAIKIFLNEFLINNREPLRDQVKG